jgi:DNA polymerase III alpha subunit (gram-positive type)
MEITGKIIQVLPEQSGISKTSGKEWKLQAYVLETQEQYPKKVHFEVFGEDRVKANQCKIDDIVTVSFDIESREFNGRWYTSIRAWRVVDAALTQDSPKEKVQEIDLLTDMPDARQIDAEMQNDESSIFPF